MKIVQVIPALTRGGAERVVIDLANQLASSGDDVTIVTAVPVDRSSLPVPLDSLIQLVSMLRQGSRVRTAYARLIPWIALHRRWLFEQDIVHCHLSFGAAFGTALQALRRLSRRSRPQVVETYHAVGVEIPKLDRAIHGALLARRDVAVLMARDPFWDRFAARHPDGTVRVIPNGVSSNLTRDDEGSTNLRASLGIPEPALVIGSVGRLVRERRPDLLLEAFKRLRNSSDLDVHLLLGGDGPERERLGAMAEAAGLSDRVHFPGLVLNAAQPFSAIDVYWTINVRELTGIAALEAAMFGLPVVAIQLDPTYRAAPNDWIPSSQRPSWLAETTRDLLEDVEARTALARAQQDHAGRNHSVEAMAQAYVRLYEDVLNREGSESASRQR